MSDKLWERDGRLSRCGGALWRMSLTGSNSGDDPKNRYNRRLILEGALPTTASTRCSGSASS